MVKLVHNNRECLWVSVLGLFNTVWEWCELLLNPFPDVAGYIRHETFFLWCHFLQWQEEVGAPEGCRQPLGFALEMPWFEWASTVLLCTNRLKKSSLLALHSAHFWGKAFIPVWVSSCWLSAMTIASLLMGGCGLSHKHVEDGCKSTCVEFGGWKSNRSGDMVSLIHV